MPDFWRSSGWHLLERDTRGRHVVTDAFLRAYLARPELAPGADGCRAERALHAMLVEAPRRPITPVHLVALADPDAGENWAVFAAFRDRLLRAATLEDAYLSLVTDPSPKVPPLLLDHLVHASSSAACWTAAATRSGCAPPSACSGRNGSRSPTGPCCWATRRWSKRCRRGRRAELDVLREEDAAGYFARSDRFDTVLDVSFTRPGLDSLCRALEAWVRHFLGVEVRIEPRQAVSDERWAWHTGLDVEASAILNDLYAGRDPGEERRARLLALFRLDFRNRPRSERAGRAPGLSRDRAGRA